LAPAFVALARKSSTSSRLPAERQVRTSTPVLEMSPLMKLLNFSSVRIIRKMFSSMTMQAAVSSVNCGLLVKPTASKKAIEAFRSFTGRFRKIIRIGSLSICSVSLPSRRTIPTMIDSLAKTFSSAAWRRASGWRC
jgi:hypothetical protein